jgi:hypothetical protein
MIAKIHEKVRRFAQGKGLKTGGRLSIIKIRFA